MFVTEAEIDVVWNRLVEGGKVLMLHQQYPWAGKYGWLQDRYGLSWQLSWSELHQMDQKITPIFMFTKDAAGSSLIVSCDTQEEIDYYWEKLSAVPEAEQCGWLKDKFGVSWQIVPTAMNEMLASGDKEKTERVTRAFLKMKKFDIKELEKVAEGA